MLATSAAIPASGEPSLRKLYFLRINFVYLKNTIPLTRVVRCGNIPLNEQGDPGDRWDSEPGGPS
jgi:hypothetical protein